MSSERVAGALPLFTVPAARVLIGAAFGALEHHRQEINDLNVYPVPDGDTGTNLALTVKSILKDVTEAKDDLSPAELATLVSSSALMGARGNSGVILSQIVRGMMDVLARGGEITEATLAGMLRGGTDAAYRAVRKPVEGTMLTVIRELAETAEQRAAEPRETMLAHLIEAGWESVRKTPTLLKVLADAGVVDAGGFGLVIILDGMVEGSPAGAALAVGTGAQPPWQQADDEEDSRYTYCTSFLLLGADLDLDTLEEDLLPFGDSLLVVGTSEQIKVHIHTDLPGQVLDLATGRGTLREVEIDNMKEQTAQRRARLRGLGPQAQRSTARSQVVAVVSGEGNKRLFESMGVDFIVEGGQSMNPAAEELMRGIQAASAESVIVLPNNKNIIMAAEQVVDLVEKQVLIVPTRSMQAGLAAMVAFDPKAEAAVNLAEMQAAMKGVTTGEVTRAVRDSNVNGLDIKEGTFIGLVDEEVVTTDAELERVVETVAGRLVDEGKEIMTVLVGSPDGTEGTAEAVARLRALYPEIEIEVHEGGQPLYPLLLSAE